MTTLEKIVIIIQKKCNEIYLTDIALEIDTYTYEHYMKFVIFFHSHFKDALSLYENDKFMGFYTNGNIISLDKIYNDWYEKIADK